MTDSDISSGLCGLDVVYLYSKASTPRNYHSWAVLALIAYIKAGFHWDFNDCYSYIIVQARQTLDDFICQLTRSSQFEMNVDVYVESTSRMNQLRRAEAP